MCDSITNAGLNLVPKWVNANEFVQLLKTQLPDFEKISAFRAYPALQPGENYATIMLRITIDVELKEKNTKQLSYMIKLPHDNEFSNKMIEHMNIFHTERNAIMNILPELEQLYRDVDIEIKFGPTAHVLPQNPDENYVLMDDLCTSGFVNTNRIDCLNMNHMESILRKLAQYHAATAVRVATKGPYNDVYMNGIGPETSRIIFGDILMSFKDPFLSNLKTYKNGEKYENAVKSFFENMPTIIDKLLTYDPTEFNVLIHGDCWSNNIMFKYTEEGEIDNLVFVDFQMSRWSSPVLDLLYLIISSAQLDIKLEKFDYFIRYYYDHLKANLKLLKYPKSLPALSDLSAQILKYGEFGFITSIMTLAGVLVDPSDKLNIDNLACDMADTKTFRHMLYSNQRYHTHINELLPWFYNHGILKDK